MHGCDFSVGGLNVCLSHWTSSLRIEALPVLLAAIYPALIISVDGMKGKVDGTRKAGSKEGGDKRLVCTRSKADPQNDGAGDNILNRRTLARLTEA